MWTIGNMLWRIGATLDVEEQLAWCLEAGFAGVGVHASPGVRAHWRGISPETTGPADRERLRRLAAPLAWREVHAPFAVELAGGNLEEATAALRSVLDLAGDLRADVVTVHALVPDGGALAWAPRLEGLDQMAAAAGVHIGLETTTGFDAVIGWGLERIGVTLDVGHLYARDGADPLAPFGSLGALVERMAPVLFHLHLHDVGEQDHVEVGTGRVDWDGLLGALHRIRYDRGACLEMNPDRVTPEGIRRSLQWLRVRA